AESGPSTCRSMRAGGQRGRSRPARAVAFVSDHRTIQCARAGRGSVRREDSGSTGLNGNQIISASGEMCATGATCVMTLWPVPLFSHLSQFSRALQTTFAVIAPQDLNEFRQAGLLEGI